MAAVREGLAVIDRDIVLDVVLLLEAVLEAVCDRVPVAVCVPVTELGANLSA